MGMVIDFPSRDAVLASRRDVAVERSGQITAQVVILPVIRIERYDEAPAGFFTQRSGDPARKRKRRVSRS